jgi:hypothetical protein
MASKQPNPSRTEHTGAIALSETVYVHKATVNPGGTVVKISVLVSLHRIVASNLSHEPDRAYTHVCSRTENVRNT